MKINRTNIADHLLEYQFNLIGKTLEEAKYSEKDGNDKWLENWTISQEKHDEFKTYAIALIKKVFKCNTNRAKSTFGWFDLGWGLKIKEG